SLVNSVLLILKNRIPPNVTVDLNIPKGTNFSGYSVGLHQLLSNLIVNAVDAMPTGGNLTLQAKRKLDNVVIEISDTGEGISRELQQRIFEPFFTTKGVGKGQGLGLHLVMQEVQKHNGSISFESQAGQG